MNTVFVLQGEAMKEVGIFSASFMTNFDSLSVLITGVVTGSLLYPYLDRRGIHFNLSHRFSLGCVFGALSILSSLIVDNAICKQYVNNGSQISILWIIFNYVFVGMGEMFAVSTSYEAAFTIAPKEQKSLASAIQLFLGNGLASFIQIGLSQALASWFPPTPGTKAYVDSNINYYLYMLLGIVIFGVILNIIPAVKNWVERLKDDALDATALDLTMNSEELSSTSLGVDALELKGVDGGHHHHPSEAAVAVAVASGNRDHIEEIAF